MVLDHASQAFDELRRSVMKKRIAFALGAVLILNWAGMAMFGVPAPIPIDRLLKNTTAYIEDHPRDPMGPYTLARIHYLALATGAAAFTAYEERAFPPRVAVDVTGGFGQVARPQAGGRGGRGVTGTSGNWTEAQLREHLKLAVENYQKALAMNAKSALFHLGLASVSEAALTTGFKLEAIPGASTPAPANGDFAPLWREQAIAEYLQAYELSVEADTAIRDMPITGPLSLISYEAGQRYLAMVAARGQRDNEAPTVAKVQASIRTISNKPMNAITPIVFRLDRGAPLEDLLDASKTVTFDLDGTGRSQRYTWLRPETGILVWDPLMTGCISSGRQLFGSVTFNMFWSDGYRALDALDDNRDGAIAGSELEGLALWFDRNQDGVSQQGEVVSIKAAGIVSISARAAGRVGESLMNPAGLVTSDGRVLPTYDWTTRSLTPMS
jgi:hypothetical protein